MGQLVFASGRALGSGPGAFVIAEAGVNHNGDLALARGLVDAAAEAGADAVKFQTFRASDLVAAGAPKAAYQRREAPHESQRAMLERLELGRAQHAELQGYARERGLVFLSSPFDFQSVDLLVELGVPALKLGSGELTNLPLLRYAARTGLPLLLSTGMAFLGEVDVAARAVLSTQPPAALDLALLHCVSRYPAPLEHANVQAMVTLRKAIGGPVRFGYSDHTPGPAAPAAAVALGARVIEKHLTLDRRLPGPDHAASLDPSGFAEMVHLVRDVEAALGEGVKAPQPGEDEMRLVARRSLHIRRPVAPGSLLTPEDVAILRPAEGLPPARLDDVLGLRAARALAAGEPLRLGDVVAHGALEGSAPDQGGA